MQRKCMRFLSLAAVLLPEVNTTVFFERLGVSRSNHVTVLCCKQLCILATRDLERLSQSRTGVPRATITSFVTYFRFPSSTM
ncbi:hypothetical protein DL89DRAFT_38782 [Linderina pennispora]|uniref:Secreted protein n=1 Tax=Linderina pennispora TaxID=61395 RepID=A0A1Y1W2Z8_9FUNG|nr:uncharacterized protein DL89DRAFT_38782 [Linderina pennispora]ORX67930.1 hypothetical protein DL89DRAFT_38782 [Linderina pennispora]